MQCIQDYRILRIDIRRHDLPIPILKLYYSNSNADLFETHFLSNCTVHTVQYNTVCVIEQHYTMHRIDKALPTQCTVQWNFVFFRTQVLYGKWIFAIFCSSFVRKL